MSNTTVKSSAKYIRISPKKLRPVLNLIRGKNALKAEAELSLVNKGSVPVIKKALKAAIADAEHNFNMKKESLVISAAGVDEGPVLKRYQPRARGMAYSILKRTSHITIVLSGEETAKAAPKKTEIPTAQAPDSLETKETAQEASKPQLPEEEKAVKAPDTAKKIFRRKTG